MPYVPPNLKAMDAEGLAEANPRGILNQHPRSQTRAEQ